MMGENAACASFSGSRETLSRAHDSMIVDGFGKAFGAQTSSAAGA
jgi:hypothetical protein